MLDGILENNNVDINKVPKEMRTLNIKSKLPQILIPDDKVIVFKDWWNQDIRFQTSIPKSFSEGYLLIDNSYKNTSYVKKEYYRPLVKKLAEMYKCSFSRAEDLYFDLLDTATFLHIYFIFKTDDEIKLYVYDKKNTLHSTIEFKVGNSLEPSDPLELDYISSENFNIKFNYFCTVMFATAMWYLATSNKDRYYYEKSNEKTIKGDKDIVYVRKHKTISTPIYDFGKVRKIKVESLIKHRKGWTYSHAFQVHGHYRHYKDGKVVFVESYIKGRDKELKSQVIRLDPKTN